MAQEPKRCNGAGVLLHQRVVQHLNLTARIDQRDIKAAFGGLPIGVGGEEFGCGIEYPANLGRADPAEGSIEALAFLHFDKDDVIAMCEDEVYFAALTPEAAREKRVTSGQIVAQDRVFCREPCVIIAGLPHLGFSFSSAA